MGLISALSYREYKAGDEEQIVPLLVEAFNAWPKMDLKCSALDHWRWKYLDNPYCLTLSSVALSGDEIIGVSCQLPLSVKIGTETMLGAYAADMAVRSDYRNRGISKKLVQQDDYQRRKNKFYFAYFITSKPFLVKSYSRDYHRFPFRIANMVRVRDLEEQFEAMPMKRTYLIKLGYTALKAYNQVRNLLRKKEIGKYPVKILMKDELDEGFEELQWSNINYRFIVDKNRPYLKWRFLDPRAGNYQLKFCQDGKHVGYIITAVNRFLEKYAIEYIIDLLATPGSNGVIYSLVRDAGEYFDKLGVNIVVCQIVKGYPYEDILAQHGFLDSTVKLYLFTNLNQMNKEDLLQNCSSKDIHFTFAAIDSLPVEIPGYAFYS